MQLEATVAAAAATAALRCGGRYQTGRADSERLCGTKSQFIGGTLDLNVSVLSKTSKTGRQQRFLQVLEKVQTAHQCFHLGTVNRMSTLSSRTHQIPPNQFPGGTSQTVGQRCARTAGRTDRQRTDRQRRIQAGNLLKWGCH